MMSRMIIKKRLNKRISGMMDSTIFLLLFFSSLMSLEMATGSPREQRVMNRLKVGRIME